MHLMFDQNKSNVQVQKSGSKILIHWEKHITSAAAVLVNYDKEAYVFFLFAKRCS